MRTKTAVGNNVLNLVVVSESGTKQNYTINIERLTEENSKILLDKTNFSPTLNSLLLLPLFSTISALHISYESFAIFSFAYLF